MTNLSSKSKKIILVLSLSLTACTKPVDVSTMWDSLEIFLPVHMSYDKAMSMFTVSDTTNLNALRVKITNTDTKVYIRCGEGRITFRTTKNDIGQDDIIMVFCATE